MFVSLAEVSELISQFFYFILMMLLFLLTPVAYSFGLVSNNHSVFIEWFIGSIQSEYTFFDLPALGV